MNTLPQGIDSTAFERGAWIRLPVLYEASGNPQNLSKLEL